MCRPKRKLGFYVNLLGAFTTPVVLFLAVCDALLHSSAAQTPDNFKMIPGAISTQTLSWGRTSLLFTIYTVYVIDKQNSSISVCSISLGYADITQQPKPGWVMAGGNCRKLPFTNNPPGGPMDAALAIPPMNVPATIISCNSQGIVSPKDYDLLWVLNQNTGQVRLCSEAFSEATPPSNCSGPLPP
jgi:hypothetical protein